MKQGVYCGEHLDNTAQYCASACVFFILNPKCEFSSLKTPHYIRCREKQFGAEWTSEAVNLKVLRLKHKQKI